MVTFGGKSLRTPSQLKLAGCTLFITGASRGIGKAIALKAARDGANIVIAPHPKLPGTIYTAAQEGGGGEGSAGVVDIRDEQQIGAAVKKAVDTFGGIDILVNNASAISLTGTLETPMKKVDLMLGINLRGTYLTSKLVIPHLLNSRSPHILNLAPPLNLNPILHYGEYGSSMSIAVNALWPRTAIQDGGDGHARRRGAWLSSAVRHHGGTRLHRARFLIERDLLRGEGVQDFRAVRPGHPLLPDFFLDEAPEGAGSEDGGARPAKCISKKPFTKSKH
uniref:Hydroxysteroid dehydrogenase like 2 n=1 Tax=Neogobius melanostomus TaxID=47308 RepID=A0A8C6SJK8_9GOBI